MTQHSNPLPGGHRAAAPASMPADLDGLAREHARLMSGLASVMTDAGTTATVSLARTRSMFESPNTGSAMPHIQAYGGLGARLLVAYERCLRTFGEQRRQVAATAGRQGSDRPN